MGIQKSLACQEKARRFIPGMTQLLSKRPDQFSEGVWPGYYSKAKGVEVWDLDGNRYVDMSIAGIGANVLGYADEDVDHAVKAAIDSGVSCSLNCPDEVELAALLCEIHPWAQMARFAKTGGEAMAMAVRIARASTGKDKIAFSGYHGWHDWYLAANLGETRALDGHLLPGLSPTGVPRGLRNTSFAFRYNHIEEFRDIVKKHGDDLGVIVMESIRSEKPVPGFFEEIMQVAHQKGIVLIIDEISAGFRMNTGGAHLLNGIKPDMAVFSKAMGNGYPIAAVIGRSAVMQAAQSTFISSTNWTERTGAVAALAMIRKHAQQNAGDHLCAMGRKVQKGWQSAAEKQKLKIKVGGIEPCSHFLFDYPNALVMKAYFVQSMLERGFLASTLFYAMLAHTEKHVEAYLGAADEVFADIVRLNHSGTLEKSLKGLPAVAGFKRLT